MGANLKEGVMRVVEISLGVRFPGCENVYQIFVRGDNILHIQRKNKPNGISGDVPIDKMFINRDITRLQDVYNILGEEEALDKKFNPRLWDWKVEKDFSY